MSVETVYPQESAAMANMIVGTDPTKKAVVSVNFYSLSLYSAQAH